MSKLKSLSQSPKFWALVAGSIWGIIVTQLSTPVLIVVLICVFLLLASVIIANRIVNWNKS